MKQRITARIVLLNHKNEILLLKRIRASGSFWFLPGGAIENNETLLLAAQRELYEEIGIKEANFTTPHSWYSESVVDFHGEPTLFKEHLFLAPVMPDFIINSVHADEKEREAQLQWWDLRRFLDSGERFHPQPLLLVLTPVVYRGHRPMNTTVI
jgi:8-oxo-dGTP pyrophosphatase MutT (NUDIX family)